ncbi:MAG: hypothetical protein F6K00_21425 [Leptolyngbya sp. SIOISBB]|nr:hypothetical protein [Leptolyngbya sp. SIOISBB]
MASASSKVVTPEALDMAISEAAQEFVESVLDEYADILEGAFDTAYDPLKSSMKSVSKQLMKAEKAAIKGGDATAVPAVVIPQESFQSAVDSFETLQATTAGFKAQLESSPNAVQEMLEVQIGEKMAALEQAIAEAATTVGQIATDVASLDAADPATTTAFSEHATALTQAIESVDLAIDGFDS